MLCVKVQAAMPASFFPLSYTSIDFGQLSKQKQMGLKLVMTVFLKRGDLVHWKQQSERFFFTLKQLILFLPEECMHAILAINPMKLSLKTDSRHG